MNLVAERDDQGRFRQVADRRNALLFALLPRGFVVFGTGDRITDPSDHSLDVRAEGFGDMGVGYLSA